MPLSVTEPNVPVESPPEWSKSTVSPPVVRLLLLASLACSVTPVVVPDAMVELVTVIAEFTSEILPGVTCTVAAPGVVTALPFIWAVIVVAVPAINPVNVAV